MNIYEIPKLSYAFIATFAHIVTVQPCLLKSMFHYN